MENHHFVESEHADKKVQRTSAATAEYFIRNIDQTVEGTGRRQQGSPGSLQRSACETRILHDTIGAKFHLDPQEYGRVEQKESEWEIE